MPIEVQNSKKFLYPNFKNDRDALLSSDDVHDALPPHAHRRRAGSRQRAVPRAQGRFGGR